MTSLIPPPTVLITGGASGIGRACVTCFQQAGWQVVVLDRLPTPNLPDSVSYHLIDLADPVAIENLGTSLAHLPIHALINNAAVQICKSLVTTDLHEWEAIMAVNLRAPYLLMRHFYPQLKASQGAVVNIASVHALATSGQIAAYAASKGALVALTRAVAIEWAMAGIRVNALLPGAVATDMLRDGLSRSNGSTGSAATECDLDERLNQLAQRTLLGRVGHPAELAEAVLFLADGHRSGFMTGQTLVVDGGALARLSTE